ncbi:MAG: PAS domain S-box protein [Prolixibacteraceae bacterium]|nr:PAS domain S-box protein [Prolixibacteraceae bacterium]
MKRFLLLSFLFITPFLCFAVNDTLILSGTINSEDLFRYVNYFETESRDISIEDISRLNFKDIKQRKNSNTINFGTSKNVYWFKFNLKNISNIEEWILSIDYPTLNDVIIYVLDEENKTDTICYSGINNKTDNKFLDNYTIYHNIKLKKDKTYSIYLKIETNSFIIVPIAISTLHDYLEKDKSTNRMVFLLYGLIVAIMILNFTFFVLTREINYLLLGLFLLSLLINSFYLFGYGIEISPNLSPYMKTAMRQIMFSISSIIFLVFTINYLDLRNFKPIFNTYRFLILFCLILIVVVVFKIIPLSVISKIAPLLLFTGTIICFAFGVFSFKMKHKTSFYYLISFSTFLISISIYTLVLFDLIAFNFFTLHIVMFAGASYGIILTIGLVEKITAIKAEKDRSVYLEKINIKLKKEIIERKKIESALRESEEKFRLFFNLIPLPVMVADYEKIIIEDGNFKLFEITGLNKEECIGLDLNELIFFNENEKKSFTKSLFSNNIISGEEYIFKLKNNKIITCLVYAQIIELHSEKKLLAIVSDITQFKKNQQEIKKLSLAIDQSANSIIITNPKGIIEYVNNSFVKTSGYTSTEVIGKKPSILNSGYHPDEFFKTLWDTILNGETWSGELYNRKKNGEYFWEMSTISPIKDDNDQITHFVAIKENITEKKSQHDKLVDSEKRLKELNATKDLFFSIIAHDLMNPLNALLGFSGLLNESLRSQKYEAAQNYSEITDQTGRRIFELLQNLLIWSKTQSGKLIFNPIFISFEELLLTFVDLMKNIAANKNITINYKINTKNNIFLDPNMISTVLRNLISNAIKFSDKDSKIEVKIDEKNDYFEFIVEDYGCGIDQQQINDLFNSDENKTVTSGMINDIGKGLGLIICRDFISIHTGKIWGESKNGKGSIFHFTIPK